MKIPCKLAGLLIVAFTIAFVGCNNKNKNNGNKSGHADSTFGAMAQNKNRGLNYSLNASNNDFIARLTGENEPHKVQTNATGTVYFKINNDTSKIWYTIRLSNADSVTMAQLHLGIPGQKGPIVVWLYPGPNNPLTSKASTKAKVNGILKRGSFIARDLTAPMQGDELKDLIRAMNHDSTYVNVANKAHPKGYLRGEIHATGMNNSNSSR